ncbi:thiol reductant ABC exporter subunit CydD [Nocardioides guangzhouensis]|uniref:Thiol reductant ABC exporter subunit CydD n=1 Tax=Nocardioides guangzhouensis TaxID=2497878 RepID=A0A4Q4Z815_9ACTN|nr:thiol reductant ABC exporter subunit CydD [Nocardioides guangzhouensis]RYP83134.1 thiol reductant ABC exporter subunit CydD [Nocardioides guangzhouensis]
MRPLDPRLLPHLRPARTPLVVALVAGAVSGLLTVAQAFALGTLVVEVATDPGGNGWHVPAGWLAGIVVAGAAASYVVDAATARAAGAVSTDLRHRLLAATAATDPLTLSRRRTGELTLLATRGLAAVEPYLTRYLPALVLATVLPVAALVAIVWLDPLSGLIVALTLPLVPVFAVLVGVGTRDRAERQWRRLSALAGHFVDVVRGLPTLVVHRRATAQSGTIRRVTGRYRRATLDTLRLAFASSAVLELVATLSVALVAVCVGLRLASDGIDFRTAMVVLLLAPEAYWPLRRVGAEFHAAAEGTAAFEAATDLLDAPPVPDRPALPATGPRPLSVRGLTVSWPDRDVPALDAVDADFPAPGLTAVTGPSGCGKSTLLATLLGELGRSNGAVSGGSIRVGDADLLTADPASWQRQVAWLPQRPWLVDGTVADNVRVGRPDADDADVWAALEQVGLGELVAASPDGIDTALGEDGSDWSAGQRARLVLSRVVLADRPFVLLDEPTAHLDSETESVLLATLRRLARRATVVVVAHRDAVVAAADHEVRLPTPAPVAVPVHAAVCATARPRPTESSTEAADRPSRWGLRTGTLLGALSVASGVALTATAAWLITRASEHPPVLYLMVAIVGVRLFGLARPALRYAERLVSHDAALRLLAERRAAVYDALVPLVPGRLGRRRGDVLGSVVDDVDALVDEQLRVRQPAWTGVLVGGAAVVVAVLLSPEAAAVVLAVCLVGGAAGLLARLGVRAAAPAFVAARSELAGEVEAFAAGIRSLVLWQRVPDALARIDATGQRLASAGTRSVRAVAGSRLLVRTACGLGVVAVAAVVPPGTVSPALLALLLLLPLALSDALLPLPDAGANAVRTRAARERVDALLAATPAVTEPTDPAALPDLPAPLTVRSVDAAWDTTPVLRGLDLDLRPGRRLGLVGPSGSGKSTVAALLVRFLDPVAGRVALGPRDLRELATYDLRGEVTLVDDDPHVFASTVLENVRLARPDASDDDVRRALTDAGLGAWVASLPDGTDTFVGEGHADVSGGERARLAIARALLADHDVVVLDEPTAHLDTATARAVAAEVLGADRGRTVLWITHGRVGLDLVDDVLVLGDPADAAATAG